MNHFGHNPYGLTQKFLRNNPFKVPVKPWTVKAPALQPGQQEYTIREV